MSNTKDEEMPVPKTLDEANEVIGDLRSSITSMDAISQDGFDKIESLANLLIKSLYSPEGTSAGNIIDIVYGLKLIKEVSQICQNDINCLAEDHFCNYRDESQRKLSSHIYSQCSQSKELPKCQEATNHG